jgi:hypothetical protein
MALVETSGGSASPVGAGDGGGEWAFGAGAATAGAAPDVAKRRTAAAADSLLVDPVLRNQSPLGLSLLTGKIQGIRLENDCQ